MDISGKKPYIALYATHARMRSFAITGSTKKEGMSMRRALKLSGVFIAAVLAGTTLAQTGTAAAAVIPKGATYVPGEVIVVMRSQGRLTSPLLQARALARKVGARVTQVSARSGAAVIKAGAGAD